MTDREKREKLVNLIKVSLNENIGKSCWLAETIADYLLENGVIVPPCKVGDTVYFDAIGYHDSAEIDGIHIDAQGMHFTWVQYDVGVDITELWDEGEFDIEEIGKTVFLTKEEAEKALAERSKSNERVSN